MTVVGLLLAAGAGRRMGTPKGLLRDADGMPFVVRGVDVLLKGGCDEVTVVVGASADEVTALLPDGVQVVVADDWDEGMGASLRAGLSALSGPDAALVLLVDLPDVDVPVVRRVLAAGTGADALTRTTYDGRPGHPVLIGSAHWAGVVEVARGDRGARDYLATHDVRDVECADLATGRDVDHPSDLSEPRVARTTPRSDNSAGGRMAE